MTMPALQIALGVFLILFSVIIILVVLGQEGHQKDVNVVASAHSEETFFSKNKGRSLDAFLERWTKFFAVGLILLVILTNVILFFANK